MAGGLTVGLNAHFYYNTGTYGTPVWTVIPIVRDVTLDIEVSEADAASRQSQFAMVLKALRKGPIEAQMLADTSVTAYGAMRDAALSDNIQDIAMADGLIATSGTQYFRADYLVFGFKLAQPLEDAAKVDLKFNLAYSTHTPAWTNVP